jgi:hypothetical protein
MNILPMRRGQRAGLGDHHAMSAPINVARVVDIIGAARIAANGG